MSNEILQITPFFPSKNAKITGTHSQSTHPLESVSSSHYYIPQPQRQTHKQRRSKTQTRHPNATNGERKHHLEEHQSKELVGKLRQCDDKLQVISNIPLTVFYNRAVGERLNIQCFGSCTNATIIHRLLDYKNTHWVTEMHILFTYFGNDVLLGYGTAWRYIKTLQSLFSPLCIWVKYKIHIRYSETSTLDHTIFALYHSVPFWKSHKTLLLLHGCKMRLYES